MQATKPRIGKAEVQRAADLLAAYRRGKQALDQRIIEDERWYRLRHGAKTRPGEPAPASAWLLNSLLGKHGDMMDNYPAPDVLPREPSDTQDAKTLSRILPVVLERSDFEGLYSRNAYPKLRHGTACYGVFWDTEAEDGLGDIRVTAVDLLNLFWEPGVRDVQDSRNVFLVTLCDNDLLDAAYPELSGKLRSPVEATTYRSEDALDRSGKSQVVDWYYKKRLPGGKTIVHFCKFVGSTVLYATENEPMFEGKGLYDHGQYPFVLDVLFPLEDSPAGFGYVDLMKGTQSYIDQLDSILLNNARLAGRPRWFYRDACGVNEQEFADFTRDFVHVTGRLDPDDLRQIEVEPLPAFIANHLQNKVEELKETSGNRDFAQGGTSSGVTAASAIAALQEAGSKLSRDLIKGSYRAFTQVCTLVIELIRQFYDDSRAVRITGEDGKPLFLTTGGLARRDHRPAFDIQVRAQKASPFSQMSRNEQAKELYRLGFFRPELATQALIALEMMDFEGIETVRGRIAEQARLQMTALQQPSLSGGQAAGHNQTISRPLTVAEQQIPKAAKEAT